MKKILWAPLLIAIGAAFTFSLMSSALEGTIILRKDQWRCIEYLPGAAECAVYEHGGKAP